jgi:predicted hydrocarbon binding protein
MSQHGEGAEPRFEGTVTAAFPLALLQSVRAHDHPGEVLEEEDLSVSLPRRLGLTGIVDTQIRRYESDQRTGRQVGLNEVASLVRLVLRRPDAEPILRETGQRIARLSFETRPRPMARLIRHGPAALALRSARHAGVRTLRSLNAGTAVEAAKPFVVSVADCFTARVDGTSTGCALFTGLIEEQLLLYTGKPRAVRHSRCSAGGADLCEWTLGDG